MSSTAPGSAPVYAYALGDALYLNVTSACTLACVFCPKIRDDDWVVGGHDLRLLARPTADEVWGQVVEAGLAGRPEVVFTGLGEPTRSLDVLLEVARRLRDAGVARVRVDTDGLANLREGRDVTPDLAAAGVGAVVVSLNAPDASHLRAHLPESPRGSGMGGCARLHSRRAAPRSGGAGELRRDARARPDECRREAESLGATFRWRPYDRVGRLKELGGNA